jgi:signal transduction histidine kinase
VSRVLQDRGHVVIGLQTYEPGRREDGLQRLHRSILGHYFRLQTAERHLSARSRQRRRGGGAKAIRQVEMERQRLGRELHTGVGQLLASIRLQREIIAHLMPEPAAAVQQALNSIGELAAAALDQVRSISKRLHPPGWQRLSLEEALGQLWEISGIPQRFEAALEIQPPPRQPDLEIKVLLYRAAQEALSNLVRHARATCVQMALACSEERLILTVRDDGVGFAARALFSAAPTASAGIGLRAIREQAEGLGARFSIESGAQGTTLEVSAPFTPAE